MLPNEEKLDPRVKRTRELLENSFLDLLGQKGFEGITVQDITDHAQVNRATFYAHFADKFALLDYTIRQSFRQEIEQRMLNACHYSMDNLRSLIVAVCEYLAQITSHCPSPQGQFDSLVETQVKNQIHGLLLAWLKKLDMDIPAEMAATAASWAIYGLALQWSRDQNSPSAEEFAQEVLPLVAGNLRLEQAA